MWNPLESIRRQVEEHIYTQLVVKPISTKSELGRDGCLTSLLSVLSNSTTRPPLSPVAKCSPLLSNSMAEMMSTAAHQSSDMLNSPQLSMFRLPHFICSRACFQHNSGIAFCTLEMVHVDWTGTRKVETVEFLKWNEWHLHYHQLVLHEKVLLNLHATQLIWTGVCHNATFLPPSQLCAHTTSHKKLRSISPIRTMLLRSMLSTLWEEI